MSNMRPLHWVIKCGDLRQTVNFYSTVLGLKVLRHEEFLEGCEATCNGRYRGAWSKTILGKTSERDAFCLEIIFNWGVSSYSRGNAYRRLKVQDDETSSREKTAIAWWQRTATDKQGLKAGLEPHTAEDPDGNLLEFVPLAQLDPKEDFIALSLHVTHLVGSVEFYKRAFHATVLDRTERFGVVPNEPSQLIRFGTKGTAVELVELPSGVELEHGGAQGRFATETGDGEPDRLAQRAGTDHVIHGPLELPPHNERVVVVVDLDGNQFAFVEASGYARCIVAGEREIDWTYRDKFAASAPKKKPKPSEEESS